jgi:hypothetical protein
MDALAAALAGPQGQRHHAVKYLHHPDGAEPDRHHHAGDAPRRTFETRRCNTACPSSRRCYADLIWNGKRPPAIHAMDKTGRRHSYRLILKIHRAGAAGRLHRRPWNVMSRMLALKTTLARARSSRWCSRNIARRILHPCAETDARPARQARHPDGSVE